jgi:hypothetical protein
MLDLLLALWPVTDYQGRLSAEAAYVIVTRTDTAPKCCGRCDGGVIVHGDGHVTDCPCPPTCKCKTAVRHPPIEIRQ